MPGPSIVNDCHALLYHVPEWGSIAAGAVRPLNVHISCAQGFVVILCFFSPFDPDTRQATCTQRPNLRQSNRLRLKLTRASYILAFYSRKARHTCFPDPNQHTHKSHKALSCISMLRNRRNNEHIQTRSVHTRKLVNTSGIRWLSPQ